MEAVDIYKKSDSPLVWRVVYESDDCFFDVKIIQRDNEGKKTKVQFTELIEPEGEPVFGDEVWITDSQANPEAEDPIGDWLFWILRMLGRKFNRPFGSI